MKTPFDAICKWYELKPEIFKQKPWQWLQTNFNLKEVDPLEDLSEEEIDQGWAWDMACLDYDNQGISFNLISEAEGRPGKSPDYYLLKDINFYIKKTPDYQPYRGPLPLGLSVDDDAGAIKEKLGIISKGIEQKDKEGNNYEAMLTYNHNGLVYKLFFCKERSLYNICIVPENI